MGSLHKDISITELKIFLDSIYRRMTDFMLDDKKSVTDYDRFLNSLMFDIEKITYCKWTKDYY